MSNLKKLMLMALLGVTLSSVACGGKPASTAPAKSTTSTQTALKLGTAPGLTPLAQRTGAVSKVYFTRDISAAGLKKVYARINQDLTGKVAVKLHTGEPNGPYILDRGMVKDFLTAIPNSTIVECNVLYPSPRRTTAGTSGKP
jgi:hypothetical protein